MGTPDGQIYAPMPVPARDGRHPSVRDDVRRTIRLHKFQPSQTHFTHVHDIYRLYLADTSQNDNDSPDVEDKFRSALGRVLRPPEASGDYAKSFAIPNLVRWNGSLSIVSPDARQVNPKEETKKKKLETGKKFREEAQTSSEIIRKRAERREKSVRDAQCPPVEEETQPISFRYIDEFIALKCAEDLIRLRLFPNGKEVAESMCAYATVRQYFHVHDDTHPEKDGVLSFRDKNVLLLAVGDGCTPRTAALFAFRSAWRCVSIDPAMKTGEDWESVANLQTIKTRVQDVTVRVQSEMERVVVVMWHCHCSILDALGCLEFDGLKWDVADQQRSLELRKRVAVVSCACCNYDSVQRTMPDGSKPDVVFEDKAVPGLMRTVRVWKFRS